MLYSGGLRAEMCGVEMEQCVEDAGDENARVILLKLTNGTLFDADGSAHRLITSRLRLWLSRI